MSKQARPHPKPKQMRHFIREWRKHRGFTQEQLAEAVGVSTSSISQLEAYKQGFTDSTLQALSEALSCEPGDLLMRNPLDVSAPWSIWDNVQHAPADTRNQIIAVIETMLKTGTDK